MSYRWPRISSGAIQYGVPTTVSRFSRACVSCAEKPKSAVGMSVRTTPAQQQQQQSHERAYLCEPRPCLSEARCRS